MNNSILSVISLSLIAFTGCRGEDSKSGQADADLQSSSLPPRQASVGQTKASELQAQVRAFLDVIAYAEGTNGSYNVMYGGAHFSSFADHPRKWRASPWGTSGVGSDAAGRYQFKSSTWDEARSRKKLKDFSEANQDRAAVYLMERNGSSTYENVKNAHIRSRFNAAVTALSHVWASMPPQRYKNQTVKSNEDLWAVYQRALAKYN
jgi:muramidase (phage lysozyme)